jgi:hypothetical protein
VSLTETEIRQLLAATMGYDNRRPGDLNVAAWIKASEVGRWTFDEALEAVHHHGANSTEFLVPAHVTQRIRAERQDRAMREAAPKPDPDGQRRMAALTAGAFHDVPAADEQPARRGPLSVPCPHCQAQPGQGCTRPSHGGPKPTQPHPSRRDAARGEAA